MPEQIHVTGLDHLVLSCRDVERTLAWYTTEIGLAPVRLAAWRDGTAPFPSLRIDEGTIIDLLPRAGDAASGGPDVVDGRLDHICLVIDELDLTALAASGRFDVVDGPAPRFGARGAGTSLYVRDPDGLVVELRHY